MHKLFISTQWKILSSCNIEVNLICEMGIFEKKKSLVV